MFEIVGIDIQAIDELPPGRERARDSAQELVVANLAARGALRRVAVGLQVDAREYGSRGGGHHGIELKFIAADVRVSVVERVKIDDRVLKLVIADPRITTAPATAGTSSSQ